MNVYCFSSDGFPVEITRIDGLETITSTPELANAFICDDAGNLSCKEVELSINSEIDAKALRRAFEIADAIMATARIMARNASISVDEALYAIERLSSVSASTAIELAQLRYSSEYDDVSEEDYISELRAESMEPHPVIVVFPALEELRQRSLHELYGQGVDAGPLAARPGMIRPADDGPWRAETGA